MNLEAFRTALNSQPDSQLVLRLPSGQTLDAHFHVTEVGKVQKDFVDCGGQRRSLESCVLQTLVANDTDHRLLAGKLQGILDKATVLDLSDTIAVEVEIQADTICLYEIDASATEPGQLTFQLKAKHTACLAPDKCGLEILPIAGDCSGTTGCC